MAPFNLDDDVDEDNLDEDDDFDEDDDSDDEDDEEPEGEDDVETWQVLPGLSNPQDIEFP